MNSIEKRSINVCKQVGTGGENVRCEKSISKKERKVYETVVRPGR